MAVSQIEAGKDQLRALTNTHVSVKTWWVIVAGAALAAFLIAAFVSSRLMATEIVPDFVRGYHPGALGIQQGVGYVDRAGDFITEWPPGFSTFISPWVVDDVRESVNTLRFISGFMAAGWVILIACLFRFLLPEIPIIPALAAAIFWPPMWAMGDPTRSEMLFTLLSSVGVLALVYLYRPRSPQISKTVVLTVVGWLAFTAAALTKTTGVAVASAMFFAVAFGFHSWSIRRRAAVSLLGATVFVIGLAPWLLAYKNHTGNHGFTSNGFASVRHGLTHFSRSPFGLELKARSVDWQSWDDMWTDVRDVAADDRIGAVKFLLGKIVRPWYATWSRQFDRFLLVIQLPWLILFVLASTRALMRWKQTPGEIILLHGFVAALWFMAFLVAPILRYISPGFPFVVATVSWHALDAGILGPKLGEAE